MPVGNKPIKVFKCRGVKVAVFQNPSKNGEQLFHTVGLQRIYRDGEQWKVGHSYTFIDTAILQRLLSHAQDFMLEKEEADRQKIGADADGEEDSA